MAFTNEDITKLGLVEVRPGVFERPTRIKTPVSNPVSNPKPKLDAGQESLDIDPVEKRGPGRIVVHVTAYRQRPLDADNLAGGCKYLLDGLRYAKLIPDDAPEKITLQVEQEKVQRQTQERTVIELTYP